MVLGNHPRLRYCSKIILKGKDQATSLRPGLASSQILSISSRDNGLVMKELTQAYFFE